MRQKKIILSNDLFLQPHKVIPEAKGQNID